MIARKGVLSGLQAGATAAASRHDFQNGTEPTQNQFKLLVFNDLP
jgi:hypothetical protein